ncbi:MAG TPA: aspartyl/asparaginyl beta-hydroxylase domain-containing protein [Kofleriaceae bacterium]|jgi:hypothetical protein|nr:aspartyl/asparaginyl beta-hydroxylase domain-containing protein [Kofleriaceae bacterium]
MNFRRIRQGVAVRAFTDEIEQRAELWLAETRRQDRIKVQRETQSIPLRTGSVPAASSLALEDSEQLEPSPYAAAFPRIGAFIHGFAAAIGGELGRAYLVRLRPGGRVYRHVDRGAYYARRDRYHVVLISEHAELTCGDETVVMTEGELWWFNNKLPHESHNPSDAWRVNLIFDVLPGPAPA